MTSHHAGAACRQCIHREAARLLAKWALPLATAHMSVQASH